MSAKLSSRFKSFLVASIIQNLKVQPPAAWQAFTIYAAGSHVTRGGNIYVAFRSGVSGSVGPTHTDNVNVNRMDGTVQWVYYGPAQNPSDINSNLYIGIGRRSAWPDELSPPAATADEDETSSALASLITLSRLQFSNMRLGLRKNDWTSGKVYTAFSGSEDDADNPDLYVTIDNSLVFKCIDNNSGAPSTVRPETVQQGYLVLSDGYVWKYMGSISSADLYRFATDEFIPVSVSTIAGTDQTNVQLNAVQGEISSFGSSSQYTTVGASTTMTDAVVDLVTVGGAPTVAAAVSATVDANAVNHIIVSSPGAGYPTDTFAIVRDAAYSAPVTAGTGTLTILGGEIATASVVDPSSGYPDGCVAVVIGDGHGAKVSVTLDLESKLNSFTIDSAGSGYTWAQIIIVPGDVAVWARAIRGPHSGHGKNIATELATGTLLISYTVTSTNSPYIEDCEFRQISLMSSVSLTLTGADHAIGPEHSGWASGNLVKYLENTGQLLYLNNVPPVEHVSTQEENIKIAISF